MRGEGQNKPQRNAWWLTSTPFELEESVRLLKLIDENPLALVIAGVAVGAAIDALVRSEPPAGADDGPVQRQPALAATLGRGMLAGVTGTAVMTAFQKAVEMPLTGRGESYAPAKLVEKILPIRRKHGRERQRLNYATHFGLGLMWGAAYGVAAHRGLRGQRAVAAVFATVYGGDVVFNTALGLYEPSKWSPRDAAIDVVDKLVQAEATGLIFDNLLRGSSNSSGRTD